MQPARDAASAERVTTVTAARDNARPAGDGAADGCGTDDREPGDGAADGCGAGDCGDGAGGVGGRGTAGTAGGGVGDGEGR
ncbi:hypothetical protein JCM4914_40220 [Streptomyces platensis subsp. malvinus]